LSQGFGYPVIISLSQTIESDKKAYYAALKIASKTNEVTEWIHYFIDIILNAQTEVERQINFIIKKAHFFDKFKDVLNERQLKVIKRMLQASIKGFEGE
jgi:Fic family protein